MRTIKVVLLAWIFGALAAVSTLAVPLDITFTEGVPLHYWGAGWAIGGTFQYLHIISVSHEPQPGFVYLVGANEVLVKWDAPADCLYVLNQRPTTSQMKKARNQDSRAAHSSRSVATTASGDFRSTVCLAGMSFVVLLLIGRRLRPDRF
ncbi:MAG TPA: hypothetical protein VGV18_03570 [Verrucomicrobiae bacterium]|nr:hypothetical protein [Verrucomicrobiae bacterium]